MAQTPPDTAQAIPTLEDVAAQSGVSTATVSRCLNSPGQVSKSTRERVMQAVSDLGYAPNFGARALAAKRTNTFGAIIPTMENAIFARGLQAFQDELREHGVTLLVASSSYSPDQEEEQIRSLVTRGADALLPFFRNGIIPNHHGGDNEDRGGQQGVRHLEAQKRAVGVLGARRCIKT